jgi:hypothetical protein
VVDTLDRLRGVQASLAAKVACRARTTTNITLSGFQTIQTITPTASDSEADRRILVNAQTDTTENGIWVMDSGDWTRAPDFDGTGDVTTGTLVLVRADDSLWRLTTANPVSFGESAIAFSQVATTGSDGNAGANGLFNGTETQVTARAGDLIPLQDISNGSTAARATAQSIAETGRYVVQLQPFGFTEDVTTGTRARGVGFMVPAFMNGWQVVAVNASHFVQGSGGSNTSIQVSKTSSGSDVNLLTVALTIDKGEKNEASAATTYVIAASSIAQVANYQYIFVDVNSVPSSTPPKGLTVSIDFQRPATT